MLVTTHLSHQSCALTADACASLRICSGRFLPQVDHATTAAKLQARQQKGLAAKASEMAKLLCCTTPTVLKLFEASPDLRQTSSAALVQRLMAIKVLFCPELLPLLCTLM